VRSISSLRNSPVSQTFIGEGRCFLGYPGGRKAPKMRDEMADVGGQAGEDSAPRSSCTSQRGAAAQNPLGYLG
jgi:hypothetical protein